MTDITLRSVKGAPLTHDEVDNNFSNLKETADAAYAAVAGVGGKANAAALGVSDNAVDMGTFSGALISDNVTAKVALQELESAIESGAASATTKANASAVGISASATDLGTFTGSIIPDAQNVKQALQALETATAGKEPTLAAGTTGQYYRGDKSWQTLDKTAAGLGNVDNTSDANKPVSTAQASALANRVSGLTLSQLVTYPTSQTAVWLKDAGREGLFVWSSANLSAQVTADPVQGLYVASSADPTGAAGAWVRRFSGPASPSWFGVVGDGVTSDNGAVQAMFAAINAGLITSIAIGKLQIVVDGVTVTATKPCRVYGDTPMVSRFIVKNSARVIFDGASDSTIYYADQFYLERFGVSVVGAHSSSPLKVQFNLSGVTAGTVPAGAIDDIDISVANTSGSFANGIELVDVPNAAIGRIRVEGARVSPLTSVNAIKMSTTASGSAMDPVFDGLKAFFVQNVLHIRGEIEGVEVNRPLWIGVRSGVDWDATAVGFNPSFWLKDGHVNAEGCVAKLRGVVDIKVTGLEVFGQGVDGVTTELNVLDIDPSYGGGTRLNLRIAGCAFIGDLNYGEPSARVTTVLKLRGNAVDVENAIITDNFLQSYDNGWDIGANINGVTITDTNQYANVTTPIVDGASNGANIIARLIENGTHWQRKLNDGMILKGGSFVVTLDASGNGTIPLSSAGAVFPNGLLSAMVCNGDEGTAGDASFVVRWGSTTASSLAVAVRPNPGAVTVRVNYSATGK